MGGAGTCHARRSNMRERSACHWLREALALSHSQPRPLTHVCSFRAIFEQVRAANASCAVGGALAGAGSAAGATTAEKDAAAAACALARRSGCLCLIAAATNVESRALAHDHLFRQASALRPRPCRRAAAAAPSISLHSPLTIPRLPFRHRPARCCSRNVVSLCSYTMPTSFCGRSGCRGCFASCLARCAPAPPPPMGMTCCWHRAAVEPPAALLQVRFAAAWS